MIVCRWPSGCTLEAVGVADPPPNVHRRPVPVCLDHGRHVHDNTRWTTRRFGAPYRSSGALHCTCPVPYPDDLLRCTACTGIVATRRTKTPNQGGTVDGPQARGNTRPPHESPEQRRADSVGAAAAADDAAGFGPEVSPASRKSGSLRATPDTPIVRARREVVA